MIKTKKNGNKVWVTFTVEPSEEISDVVLCGEWNEWEDEPMKQKKNGEFYITKVLPAKSRFEFGYKVNGEAWLTDEECEKVETPFGSSNAVLEI